MKLKQLTILFFAFICLGADAQLTYNGVTLPAKLKQRLARIYIPGDGIAILITARVE